MTSIPKLYTQVDGKFSPSKFSKTSGRSASSGNDFDTIDNISTGENISKGVYRVLDKNNNNQTQSNNNLLKETATSKARRKSANAALNKRGHSFSSSLTILPTIGNEKNRQSDKHISRGRSTASSSSSFASAYDKVDDNVFHAALQELNQIKQEYRGSGSVRVKSGTRGDSSESKRANSPATSAISVPCPPYPTSSALTRRSNSSTSSDSDSTNYSPSGGRFHHSFAAGATTTTKDFESNTNSPGELSNQIYLLREERDRATSKLKVAEKVMRQLYHKSKELQEAADSSARPLSSGNKIKNLEDNVSMDAGLNIAPKKSNNESNSEKITSSNENSKTPHRTTKSNDDISSSTIEENKDAEVRELQSKLLQQDLLIHDLHKKNYTLTEENQHLSKRCKELKREIQEDEKGMHEKCKKLEEKYKILQENYNGILEGLNKNSLNSNNEEEVLQKSPGDESKCENISQTVKAILSNSQNNIPNLVQSLLHRINESEKERESDAIAFNKRLFETEQLLANSYANINSNQTLNPILLNVNNHSQQSLNPNNPSYTYFSPGQGKTREISMSNLSMNIDKYT